MTGTDIMPRPDVPPPVALRRPGRDAERRGESAPVRVFRLARRRRDVSIPLAVPPVLWAAGDIIHAGHWGLEASLFGAGVSASVWYFASRKWDRPAERLYARASAIGGFGWLTAAAFADPGSGTSGLTLGALLAVGGLAWGGLFFWHKRPRRAGRQPEEAAGPLVAQWDGWWQEHCGHWQLGGSRVTDVETVGVTVKLVVRGVAGRHSIEHVRQVRRLIESGLDGMVRSGRVRVQEDPDNPSIFWVFIKKSNPLAKIIEWDPALAPDSVHGLMPIGITETGEWKMAPMRASSFTIGTTDSGKSNMMLVRLLCLAGCRDARSVLIDLKEGRSARPVLAAACAEYVITNVGEARMYLLMLVAETAARQKGAYAGHEQLLATEDIPAICTKVDETRDLTSQAAGDAGCRTDAATVASKGRSVEAYEDFTSQYGALDESLGTHQIRLNLRQRAVFRLDDPSDAQYAMPKHWRDLDASKLEEKGSFYWQDGPDAHPEQIRSPYMPHEAFVRLAAEAVAERGPLGPLRLFCGGQMSPAGVTWQEWWDRRWLRLDPAFRAISSQYAAAVALYGDPDAVPASRPEPEQREPPAASVPAAAAPSPSGPVLPPEKHAFAAVLAAAGPEGTSPGKLADASGMGRTWIHERLKDLIERGVVIQLKRGSYRVVPGQDIYAALAALERETDDLFAAVRLHAV